MSDMTIVTPFLGINGQSLMLTSLPSVLFDRGNQNVVEGSVIWLYCEVNSTDSALRVVWHKNGIPLVQDVPHIRMRSYRSANTSTFLLVVDNFQAFDAGTYTCEVDGEGGAMAGEHITMESSPIVKGSLLYYSIKH